MAEVEPDMAEIMYPTQSVDTDPAPVVAEEVAAEVVDEPPAEGEPPADEPAEPAEELPAAAEATDDTEPAEADQPEAATVEEEEETITSFSQLVEHQEWDPEWANKLTVPVKVDGVESEATIGDLVASHQMIEAAGKRLDDAKEKAQTTYQGLADYGEQVKNQLAQSAGLIKLAENLFDVDAQEANLATLRDTDETAYLVAKDRLVEQRASLDRVKAEAGKIYQSAAAELTAPMDEEARLEMVNTQQSLLHDRIPAWKDDAETGKREAGELVEYLTGDSYGFTQEQISQATGAADGAIPMDHRLFDMARKAMLYDRDQANVQDAIKKVVKIPKVLKPGVQNTDASPAPRDAAEVLYGRK